MVYNAVVTFLRSLFLTLLPGHLYHLNFHGLILLLFQKKENQNIKLNPFFRKQTFVVMRFNANVSCRFQEVFDIEPRTVMNPNYYDVCFNNKAYEK